MAIKYTKWQLYITNGHNIYQFKGPRKFIQFEILGLKIFHLATLGCCKKEIKRFSQNARDQCYDFENSVTKTFYIKVAFFSR
jgi:hypothetical protein